MTFPGTPRLPPAFDRGIDASKKGLGAVLSQVQDGKKKVIAYASRSLRVAEQTATQYQSFKLELMGLRRAVADKFRHYLLGYQFTEYTDNAALGHLATALKLSAVE